jgi:UDP-N-acetyl-D-glucosamine dehydrogenase
MPQWVVGKVTDALNARGKAIKGSNILVLGIAYKKDVDDTRESPAVELMALLSAKGARVNYSDPHVPMFPKLRKHRFDLASVELTPEALGRYDVALLVTDHSAFDYTLILRHASIIVDTRGVYLEPAANVVKA